MVAVAVVAHQLIDGLSWAAAFTLGAIVSPTDTLAGAQIMRRLEFPRFFVSAIEAEGLFNDATALVCFRVAVAAVVGGSFSLLDASWKFLAAAAGGIAIGLAIGWVIAELRARTTDAPTSVTISLFSGYAAFIPANAIGASGVLAAVTHGLVYGHPRTERDSGPDPSAGDVRVGDARLHRQRAACSCWSGYSCTR